MKKRAKKDIYSRSSGFTIVELMIATLVFSTILVAITVGVLHFSALYYRSVYMSEAQNTARNIADEVANAVKFGTGSIDYITDTPNDGENVVFCAGGYVFVTTLGQQYTGSNTGFYMQPKSTSACNDPGLNNATNRQQLLSERMRVAGIQFYQNDTQPNVYTLKITIAYGDNDLLTATSDPDGNVQCKSGAGSEYCAVSSLTTTIEKRI